MKELLEAFDNLPKIVKIIFALPGLDVIWAIYRVLKGVLNKNMVTLVAGLVWLFAGWAILWIADIVMLAMKDKLLFAD